MSELYEIRFGWNRRTVFLTGFCLLLVVLAVVGEVLPKPLPVYQAVFIGVFGLIGMVLSGWAAVTRPLALRADDAGITLTGSLLRPEASRLAVPWTDLEAIVLWRQPLPRGTTMPYIGLRLREGAAAPRRPSAGKTGVMVARALTPGVPPELVRLSVAINMWRLNGDRLVAAVASYAPGVRIEHHPSW